MTNFDDRDFILTEAFRQPDGMKYIGELKVKEILELESYDLNISIRKTDVKSGPFEYIIRKNKYE